MTEKSWTLLVFICLLMGTLPAVSSLSKYDWLKSNEPEKLQKIDKVTKLKTGEELEGLEIRYDRFGNVFQIPFGRGGNYETATTTPPMPLKVGKEEGPSPLGPGTRKTSVSDEPSPIAPDTSFANFKSGDTGPSSSTATAAPKKVKKGKKVQEWWSVEDVIYDLLTHVIGWSLCAIIYWKWYRVQPRAEPERAETNELNALVPPLDEASARRRKEKIIKYGLKLLKLKAHYEKVTAEHKSGNRTAKFSRLGPIYIRRESPIPPEADRPENIVLEKITYDLENNEEWIIEASIEESDLSDTEDEDDGGSKKSKNSKNDSKNKKKKTEGNKTTAPTAPLPPAAPTSTAFPTPSLATTGTPDPSEGIGKATDANEKKEEKKNTN
ncbi:hypothetical protein CAEBREN_15126 [Caenorhabditis brenneri]|uniref:Uncharacterized protein n=1 Tax=Caenorhabditis brenneri TaxID=135651 RepID=G0MJU0_CAEBE|nr:hypothetical protein CAEBREN_15126 [Caenorhabditis brenneri]